MRLKNLSIRLFAIVVAILAFARPSFAQDSYRLDFANGATHDMAENGGIWYASMDVTPGDKFHIQPLVNGVETTPTISSYSFTSNTISYFGEYMCEWTGNDDGGDWEFLSYVCSPAGTTVTISYDPVMFVMNVSEGENDPSQGGDEPEISDVPLVLAINGETLSTQEGVFTLVDPEFTTLEVSAAGTIELGPGDEWGNEAVMLIKIYDPTDEWQMSVGGIESYTNGALKLYDPIEVFGNFVVDIPEGVFLIDGLKSPAAKFYFTNGEPEVKILKLYVRGAFNEYAEAGEDQWELAETNEGSKIFKGTFEVPVDQYEFNLISSEGVTYRFSGEGHAPNGTADSGEEDRAGVMVFDVPDENWTAEMEMATGGEEQFYWTKNPWNGGTITLTADLNNSKITIVSDEIKQPLGIIPEELYIATYNITQSNLTPDPNDPKLVRNPETGIYEGRLEDWGKAYKGNQLITYNNGKVFYYNDNGVYYWYGCDRTGSGMQNLATVLVNPGDSQTYPIDKNESSVDANAWYFPTSAPQDSYDVIIAVDINELTATFTLYGEKPVDPEVPEEPSYMEPGVLQQPESVYVSNKVGLVTVWWTKDVELAGGSMSVSVNAPGVGSKTVQATYVPVEETDTGENMGLPYPSIQFDLGSLVTQSIYAPYYGEWNFTIPAGMVKELDSDKVNPEQSFTLYWYKENDEFSVSPKFGTPNDTPNYAPEELANVRITWDDVVKVERNEQVTGAYIQLNGSGNEISIDDKIKAEGDALVLDLSNLEVGKYRLYIPSYYAYLTKDGVATPQVNYAISSFNNWFAVTGGMSNGTILAPFAMVDDGYPTVTSEDKVIEVEYAGQDLTLNSNVSVLLYPDEWMESVPVAIPAENVSVEGSILKINYIDNVELTEDFWSSTRAVLIPEGLVSNASGSTNPEQKVIFNVITVIDLDPVWTPEDGGRVDTDEEVITLTWDSAIYVDYYEGMVLKGANISDTMLKLAQPNWGIEGEITSNAGLLTFDFSGLNLQDGEYTIEIPAGVISIETEDGALVSNPEMSYTFTAGKKLEDAHLTFEIEEEGQKGAIDGGKILIQTSETGKSGKIIVNAPAGYEVWYKDVPKVMTRAAVTDGYEKAENNTIELQEGEGNVEIIAVHPDTQASTNTLSYDYVVGKDVETGVSFIGADKDGVYRVYNFNGVNVLNTNNAADLDKLAKGLYIINGKKVVK